MRLFVALDLPDEVRREVARRSAPLRAQLPRARWVDPAALHMTLSFLGEVEARALDPLREAAAPALATLAPFQPRLAGGGTFPPSRPARVAWLGFSAPPALADAQAALVAAASDTLGPFGVRPDDRPFSPHVTLARCPQPWPRSAAEAFAAAFAGPIGEPWACGEAVLYRSHLSGGGPRYEPLARFPFVGAAA